MMMQRLLKSTTTMLSKSKVNANQNRSITWKNATFDEKRKTNTVQVKWTGNGINFEGTDDQGSKLISFFGIFFFFMIILIIFF